MSPGVLAEVCVASVAGARAADIGGADRIELCAALELGGITPSAGLIESCVDILPTHVLIRPRAGDFGYNAREARVMAKDIEHAIDKGAVAVVTGALTPDGTVDTETMHRLLGAAGEVPVTFHRAIDTVSDPLRTLDVLLDLGVDRLLTSGGAARAIEGVEVIAELVRRAGDDLVVMAGAGITPDHAAELVRRTGVREIHFSGRRRESPARAGLLLGPLGQAERWETSPDLVRDIIAAATAPRRS